MAEDREGENCQDLISEQIRGDEISQQRADLDKGVNSSHIAVGGKAEFMGTDAGGPVYPRYYFLVSFTEMALDSETFHPPIEGGCL